MRGQPTKQVRHVHVAPVLCYMRITPWLSKSMMWRATDPPYIDIARAQPVWGWFDPDVARSHRLPETGPRSR
jgi:hypothetical protein